MKINSATFSLAEPAASFVAQTNGQFIADAEGRFYSYSPLTNQLLEIEGEATVVRYANVSYLEGSPQTYHVAWSDGQVDLWPVAAPLPFKATGLESRIGAFFAWLHGQTREADIPDFLTDRFVFAENNVLLLGKSGPAHHYARGDTIIIQLHDGPVRVFHWTELAADLGWKG